RDARPPPVRQDLKTLDSEAEPLASRPLPLVPIQWGGLGAGGDAADLRRLVVGRPLDHRGDGETDERGSGENEENERRLTPRSMLAHDRRRIPARYTRARLGPVRASGEGALPALRHPGVGRSSRHDAG